MMAFSTYKGSCCFIHIKSYEVVWQGIQKTWCYSFKGRPGRLGISANKKTSSGASRDLNQDHVSESVQQQVFLAAVASVIGTS